MTRIFSFETVNDCGIKHIPLFGPERPRASIWGHRTFREQVVQELVLHEFDPRKDKWLIGDDLAPEVLALNAVLSRFTGVNCLIYDNLSDSWKERTLG